MGEKTALACFDFDGTMIRGDSIAAYLLFARRRGLISRRELTRVLGRTARYFLGGESGDAIKTRALRFRAGLDQPTLDQLDRDFVRLQLIPRLYPDALACWRRHREAGCTMLLVTASTENYMRLIAEYLAADALLCTRLSPQGIVTGNCKGEEKPRRIAEWLRESQIEPDWPASFAYGDSASDLPMLLLAGHPVQVDPKKALRKAAPGMERTHWTEK